jgi:hypothetical protein
MTNEPREMYSEIAALIGSLAKSFGISDATASQAVESGDITLAFGRDDSGNAFVTATFGDKTTRIYKGAIKHASEPGKP